MSCGVEAFFLVQNVTITKLASLTKRIVFVILVHTCLITEQNLLNEDDVNNFSDVSQFIVECNFKSRLLVSTFCYSNGLLIDQLFELVQRSNYFKMDRKVMYLNGDLHRFGKRNIA